MSTYENFSFILKTLKKFVKDKNISIETDTKFEEFGLDSIQTLQFIKKINDEYKIKIKYSELNKIKTIQDLINVIQNKLS